MEYVFQTPLNGKISLCDDFHKNDIWLRDNSLYKFFLVVEGSISMEIDHIPLKLSVNEIVALTPLQHLNVTDVDGKYMALLFNSNFYCIYGHDSEVSCSGVLFHGGSQVLKLRLSEDDVTNLSQIVSNIKREYDERDGFQEEMLRILLKRFIIVCTRKAHESLGISREKEHAFDIIRQFYILVDNNFREKRMVQDYALMLNRSPKTLSNLFSQCDLSSPLQIILERTATEAKRLLLYTGKSAKEIADLLHFEDIAAFSRFFKSQTGVSISEYRKENKGNRE